MFKKFFELVGIVTTGYVGYEVYKEYQKRRNSINKKKEDDEAAAEDFEVEVEDFFDESVVD